MIFFLRMNRDLKPNNIMMNIECSIKIIDFGLCAELYEGSRLETVGTSYWMAPEIIKKQPHNTKIFGLLV